MQYVGGMHLLGDSFFRVDGRGRGGVATERIRRVAVAQVLEGV
jgi:hypothetical protein